jgi:hypothetical protein
MRAASPSSLRKEIGYRSAMKPETILALEKILDHGGAEWREDDRKQVGDGSTLSIQTGRKIPCNDVLQFTRGPLEG